MRKRVRLFEGCAYSSGASFRGNTVCGRTYFCIDHYCCTLFTQDLSAGRVLDLDSLIAFVRVAQVELKWIQYQAEPEVDRDWSDISTLSIPSLQNQYKGLLTEIERREDLYFNVYDEGVRTANYGHPAVRVIEKYLNRMQIQWDWLLALANCFEIHLQDANNLKNVSSSTV